MPMKKILVLGSLNMDLVTQVSKTPRVGETVVGQGLTAIPGGKGANQAVAIGRLGGLVSMLGRVGDDNYGEDLVRNLSENNVGQQLVKALPGQSSGVAMIMVNEDGDNSIVVIPGANYELRTSDVCPEIFAGYDYLLAQLESPVEVIESAFRMAKEQGMQTILNPAPARSLSRDLLSHVDLLIPNETECESLTGIRPDDDASLRQCAVELQRRGVREIIITLGVKGACYISATQEMVRLPALPVRAIDTTAAGDGFIGGLLYGMARGEKVAEAMRRAVAVAAVAVTRLGAQSSLPKLDEVEKVMEADNAKRINS
jgi:ribokinase